MDHGYPQTTDTKILKEFIKTSSNKITKKEEEQHKGMTDVFTGVTSRPIGIKYRVNKAFLDVVEQVNSLVSYFDFII